MSTICLPEYAPADDSCIDEQPGLPGDRGARVAARRAFVELKGLFMRAVAPLQDRKGQWLQEKVRLATDPMDLWLLRGPVLAAQHGDGPQARALRAELYRGIDSVFPQAFGPGRLAPRLPPMSALWAHHAHESDASQRALR